RPTRMDDTAPSPAAIQAVVHEGVPLAAAWGVEVVAAAGGSATCRLPWRAELLRPGGTVSGPALMGLADVAMWAALLGITGGRDESLTTSLTIHFLRRLPPGPVLAEARVLKRGRIIVGEVMIRSEASEEVAAHVTTSWAAVSPSPRPAAPSALARPSR
ncbi:MAG TPA: PaaI family thioesterase, partial [Roseomonas sp.]|nr:PaaI family thioesterase [Roseomonas sp.]